MEPTREQWYQRRITELEAQVRQRDERIAVLERQVAQLAAQVAKLSKNSSNSSKPPSSDIVKPPKSPAPRGNTKRQIGGQPGHPKHDREPFGPEELNNTRQYQLDRCPDCGGKLRPSKAEARAVQQVEMIDRPVEIVEHRSAACWCSLCRKNVFGPSCTPCSRSTRSEARLF